MAVGNMAAFLPGILEVLRTDKKKEYLLLASLKEVIVLHAEQPADTSTQPSLSTSASPWLFQCSGGFAPFLEPVLERLLGFSTSPEEGVRNMVAECLGALVAMYPDRIVQQLHDLLLDQATSSSAGAGGGAAAAADSSSSGDGGEGGGWLEGAVAMRWTVAASLKYAMTASNAPHAVLSSHMGFFLALLQDADLTVVHASLQMCNAAVHHQPQLAAPFLAEAIGPALYARVTFKQERMVDLGPFKQKVDDGLPLRKAALATVNTILDTMPERFDVAAFVEPLKVSFVCECVSSSSSLSVVVDLHFFPPNLFKLYLSTPPEYLINNLAICISIFVYLAQSGLADEKDTSTLSHQILAKVCANPLFTGVVLGNLDNLVAPLLTAIKKTKQTMDKKIKEGQAGGTEVERLNDYVRREFEGEKEERVVVVEVVVEEEQGRARRGTTRCFDKHPVNPANIFSSLTRFS